MTGRSPRAGEPFGSRRVPATGTGTGSAVVHIPLLELWARPERLIIHPASALPAPGGTRSHVGDGRTVTWSPLLPSGVRYAVDAEIADQPVPAALAARFGWSEPEPFWAAWTRVEVCCKVHDVPVLTWLSRHGLRADEAVPTRILRVGDLVVCCGVYC